MKEYDSIVIDEIPDNLKSIPDLKFISYLQEVTLKHLPENFENRQLILNTFVRIFFMAYFLKNSCDWNSLNNYFDMRELVDSLDNEQIEFIKDEIFQKMSMTGIASKSAIYLRAYKFFESLKRNKTDAK